VRESARGSPSDHPCVQTGGPWVGAPWQASNPAVGASEVKLKDPYTWIRPEARFPVFWFTVVVSILLMITLQFLGRPLQTEAAPAGIVSYELAGFPRSAADVLQSWDAEARQFASLNLGLDYLFLTAYAIAIGLGCRLVGERMERDRSLLGKVGYLLAWALPLAAVLDAVENYALIRLLLGSTHHNWPLLARWAAIPKFTLVFLGLIYVLLGWGVNTIVRIRGKRA
jgi:hypothetical protein